MKGVVDGLRPVEAMVALPVTVIVIVVVLGYC